MGDNQTNINYKTLKNYFTIVAFTNIHFAYQLILKYRTTEKIKITIGEIKIIVEKLRSAAIFEQ